MGHVPSVDVEPTSAEAIASSADVIALRLASIARDLEILTRDIASATSTTPFAADPLSRWQNAAANVATRAAELADTVSRIVSHADPMPACVSPASPTPLALLSLHCQQLTLIRGIDLHAAQTLTEVGIQSFEDIAALTPDDVKELARLLGDRRRIARECWIEQACLLAEGIETAYAARVRAGDFAMLVAPPTPDAPATSLVRMPIHAPASAVIDLAGQRAGADPYDSSARPAHCPAHWHSYFGRCCTGAAIRCRHVWRHVLRTGSQVRLLAPLCRIIDEVRRGAAAVIAPLPGA